MLRFVLSVACSLAIGLSLSCARHCLIKSDPPGARISINDEYQGETPCVVKWPSKDHREEIMVEVSRSGYVSQVRRVSRDVKRLDFVLQQVSTDDYHSAFGDVVLLDEPPVLLKQVLPEYPSLAKETRIDGTVWVRALVDTTGKVVQAEIVKGSDIDVGFEEAALEAARKCEYKPALKDGKPIPVWTAYPVRFSPK
jgi:TonB family protein